MVRHDEVVGQLLASLALETERAGTLLGPAVAAPLVALLDARDSMLDALEGAIQAFTRTRAPHDLGTSTTIHAELVAWVAALQRANIQLLARVSAECDRLAAAISDADRPDDVASAYSNEVADGGSQLDLVR